MNRLTISFIVFTLFCVLLILGVYLTPTPSKNKTANMEGMKLTSSAFNNNGPIPPAYTCDGDDAQPPLTIKDIPAETKSLALIIEDPDSPSGNFTHFITWNLPPELEEFNTRTGAEGANDFGNIGYGGPCPGSGTHRYVFTLYALDTTIDLPDGSTKPQLKNAMKDHILDQTTLNGTYKRQ